ncbi:hypothetical protein TNCV_4976591 [Trichonephila clavipes]|nr:hypothetical protein TNCV_4976591 [Trichonephila clavipes]
MGGGRTLKARNALSKQSAGGARGRTQEGTRDGRRQRIKAARTHLRTQSKRRSAVQLDRDVKSVKKCFLLSKGGAERVSPPPVCCAVAPVTSVNWNANSVRRTKR